MAFAAYEIVRVLDHARLRDSRSRVCLYRRPKGVALQCGFYVTAWRSPARNLAYDNSATFYGPYPSRRAGLIMISILRTEPRRRSS
jgi:hypothetical protein